MAESAMPPDAAGAQPLAGAKPLAAAPSRAAAPSPGAEQPLAAAQLLPYGSVLEAWGADGGNVAAALSWTAAQVGAFTTLVVDPAGWQFLLDRFEHGRGWDAWLATDWPDGFDELLLCAPLCTHFAFECARCPIGSRQAAHSCAHPATVFGRIGALMQDRDRAGLLGHLENVATMLDPACDDVQWDLATARPHHESNRSTTHPAAATGEPRERKTGDADVAS